ncbi:bifunctional riboflavin kinase/FAD synthetase [Campylobacter insulaenigrae]|uniref:bifunctional riboflavin kinase/FAD synthetase n=1 Tax=Campylobacter insulaenigrae TaxID=260714 RepID=UPI002152647B|nr:bifunctional riboflavin kinase/FAD synthetase [Campylobacter insulaenigrae]MCR6594728.1 bifunctional riboflavin kinase/FAD synthetase [Campylobacter insulaenigrae]
MWSFSTPIKKSDIKKIAIGRFDGIHLGHLELCKHLDENSALLIILKNEDNFLTPGNFRNKIVDLPLIFLSFTKIKHLNAKDFLKLLLSEFVNLEKIIVGYDFKFGKERKWGAENIQELCGIQTIIVDEFKKNNISVHTSMIKEMLQNGNVFEAKAYLGRFYNIVADVIKGQGIGSKLLFATINLKTKNFFLPKNGVYVSIVKIHDICFFSITFLGVRSTDKHFSLETHILVDDFNELIPQKVELEFIDYIRENKQFDNLMDLKKQISQDIIQAKQILGKLNER